MNLIERIQNLSEINTWKRGFLQKNRQLITGLSGGSKALVMASALEGFQEKILIVTNNMYTATQLSEEMTNILGEESVRLFPFEEILAAEFATSSPEMRSERIQTLDFLTSGQKGIVIAPLSALRRQLPTPKTWIEAHLSFVVGEDFPFQTIKEQLFSLGYNNEAMVNTPGDFSVRGDIVDVYPLNFTHPVRIEFFDEEVDSIRFFDANTQRTISTIESVVISPAREFLFSTSDFQHGLKNIQNHLEKELAKTISADEKKWLENHFTTILTSLENEQNGDELVFYTDLIYQKETTLFDYFDKDSLLFVDEFSRIQESNSKMELDEAEYHTIKLAEKKAFSSQKIGIDAALLIRESKLSATFFSNLHKSTGNFRFGTTIHFTTRNMQQFFGQMPLVKAEMDRFQKEKNTVVVFAETDKQAQKIEQLLREWEIPILSTTRDALVSEKVQIVVGSVIAGFEFVEASLVVISEHELFTQAKKRRARRTNISNAERLKSYNELAVGDFVVHQGHGVGKYIGMETIELDGVHQDYMTILYQNDDKLFIPVTQLSLLSKYAASDGAAPKINKLSDGKWAKTRAKVSKQVEDIADDLIELYAKREALKGFAFSKDDAYQEEFENAFVYAETEDQLRSTQEIKKDMERVRPMDRLLVGDVGFGKTEVALRAAFKAIQDHKQVAILVPTTILAQQHYETIAQRFRNFPVEVGVLSRFRTKKEQTETLTQLRQGKLDIIVGTHRLLSKDIEFFDLGLLVVDEEQRFGVKHKERLKQLKTQVDVLTLTATPIPRTLHMSMMGVRDLSVIETPPENRYPVQTYVMETNPGAIREAILREINRDGQVFYLYNRVETIEQRVAQLKELVPEASIGFAHGQMSTTQIENVLYDFIEGQYDVLVATTIIETGVDIPNANTLFVENADKMGLSTLYQLRGRVGRTNRVAYAYFMYQPEKILSEVSEKRLQAMRDFTELGSGFKIAMRDLSIRGSGNILGAQQSGFIDAVGFELYSKMLEEAVKKRQGVKVEQKVEVEIDLQIDAYLPESYISDGRQKIEIYKRVRFLESPEMLEELKEDLVDRFGDYPREVENLLAVGEIKENAEKVGIQTIRRTKQKKISVLSFIFTEQATQLFKGEQYFEALKDVSLQASLNIEKEKMRIFLRSDDTMKEQDLLQEILVFLKSLRKIKGTINLEEKGDSDER